MPEIAMPTALVNYLPESSIWCANVAMLEMALYRSPCCSHSLTFRRQGPRNPDVRRRTQRVPSCHGGINATVNSPIRSTKPQTACPGHDLLSFDNDRRARWELTNVLIKTNTAMPSVRIWQCRR